MIAFGLAALFITASLVAIGVIVASVRRALPQMRELKAALAGCPESRELRYSIRELVVSQERDNVVALPVRIKPAAVRLLRAAA